MSDRNKQQRARKEQSKNRDQKKKAGREGRSTGGPDETGEGLGLDALIEQSKKKPNNNQPTKKDESDKNDSEEDEG